jgi:hypothetical protein
MSSGRTLWDELCHRYSAGVDAVRACRRPGRRWRAFVDRRAPRPRARLLAIQEQEARWWRNACLLYFQTFSRRPLPAGLEPLEGRWTSTSAQDRPLPTSVDAARRGRIDRHGVRRAHGARVRVNVPSTTDTRLRLQVRASAPSARASPRERAAGDREVLLQVVALWLTTTTTTRPLAGSWNALT